MKKNFIVELYFATLALIFGFVASGQLLGFLKLYTFWLAIPFSLIVAAACFYLLNKFAYPFLAGIVENPQRVRAPKTASILVAICSVLILLVVLLLPLLIWPFSSINRELIWDAGLYHLPKAAQMIVSGSSWDLSIAYGEYPYGFESLMAGALLLNNSGYLLGAAHALILLFFVLSLYLLVERFSLIPSAYNFFFVVFLVASYDLVRFIDSNPFSLFRILAFTIGKNDFFLAAAMMAFLLFSPVATGKKSNIYSLWGLTIAGFLVLTTKPNGFLLLGFVWVIVLWLEIRSLMRKEQTIKRFWTNWMAVILVNGVGILWAVRNLIVEGRVVSAETLEIQKYSIIANLTNPYLLHYLDLKIKISLALLLILLVLLFFWKRVNWMIPASMLVLLVSFAITPASAFWGSVDRPAEIAWRLGAYVIAFEAPLIFLLVSPLYEWIKTSRHSVIKNALDWLIPIFALGFCVLGLYQNYSRIIPDPNNTRVLFDQFDHSVGVNGYFSAYDYIHKNVSHSVVWVENGMPYYVFGSPITNSISRMRQPDYYVFFSTPWINQKGFPATIETKEWQDHWTLVYSDSEGRVYRNNELGNVTNGN